MWPGVPHRAGPSAWSSRIRCLGTHLSRALATSMAHTRSTTSSCSASGICSGSEFILLSSFHIPHAITTAGRLGASVKGTEILTGVLEATMRDPSRSGPRRQANERAQAQGEVGVGRPPDPIFTRPSGSAIGRLVTSSDGQVSTQSPGRCVLTKGRGACPSTENGIADELSCIEGCASNPGRFRVTYPRDSPGWVWICPGPPVNPPALPAVHSPSASQTRAPLRSPGLPYVTVSFSVPVRIHDRALPTGGTVRADRLGMSDGRRPEGTQNRQQRMRRWQWGISARFGSRQASAASVCRMAVAGAADRAARRVSQASRTTPTPATRAAMALRVNRRISSHP